MLYKRSERKSHDLMSRSASVEHYTWPECGEVAKLYRKDCKIRDYLRFPVECPGDNTNSRLRGPVFAVSHLSFGEDPCVIRCLGDLLCWNELYCFAYCAQKGDRPPSPRRLLLCCQLS